MDPVMAAPSTAGERAERIVRWAPPLIVLAFYAATAAGYGVFRDELYYFACARHLDWGYVDHPPMIAVLAALVRAVFGDSWLAARWLSAVAAAGTVLLVGDTARELGGGRWARVLAQLLCATAPVYLALFSIFSMNAFDVLVWAALIRVAARLLAGGPGRLWLVFGAIAGLGLLNKLDVGLLGAGLGIGLVLGWRVDVLRTRWIWIGGAIALVLFLPHVIWQAHHGWPTREFVANAQRAKIAYLGPLGFIAAQFRDVGPVGFTLALAGLGWLLVAARARPFRPLGWAVLTVLVVFLFLGSGRQNIVWASQISFVGALVCGLIAHVSLRTPGTPMGYRRASRARVVRRLREGYPCNICC
jgi:4-amino-4-deoxy-L-arabinose transferase-like glycosyltransferase